MTYDGRPNISLFLRELHENPTLVENDPAFSMDDTDLSMFTNTEFFDLETGQNTDFQPHPQHQPKVDPGSSTASSAVSPLNEGSMTAISDFNHMDFLAAGTLVCIYAVLLMTPCSIHRRLLHLAIVAQTTSTSSIKSGD